MSIIREHFEQIWNNKDVSGIERFIARDYRGFEAAELISGIAGYKQHFETITTAFPDLRITIDVLMTEENREAARWLVEATHTGRFGEIPPSGKRVRMTGIAIVRTHNNQIVEEHANSDALGLLTQIGITAASVTVPPLFF